MKVAVVVVLALVVATAVAGYFVYASIATTHAPSHSKPVFAYSDYGNYSWVATMVPNNLYNGTVLTGGNTTLFTPITKTINVSFTFTLVASQPLSASLIASTQVVLNAQEWSKVLNSTTYVMEPGSGSRWTFQQTTLVNWTWIVMEKSQIGNQTGYSPQAWSLRVETRIVGDVGASGQTSSFFPTPTLTENVTGDEIQPLGLTSNATGAYVPASKGGSGLLLSPFESYLFLGAAAIALAVAVALWQLQEEGISTARDIERVTGPYSEVIVRAQTVPRAEQVVRLSQWEDLVKIADTTGRPILRLESPAGRGPDRTFCVLDGAILYVFEFEGAGRSRRGSPAAPSGPRPRGSPPPSAGSMAASARPSETGTTGAGAVMSAPGARASPETVARLVDRVSVRVAAMPAGEGLSADANRELRRARLLTSQRRWDEAAALLEQIDRRLDERPVAVVSDRR